MIKLGQKESKLIDFVKDSYLELNYFEKGKGSPRIIFFPFVGAVDIKETRSTIFTDYQPISRNTTLFGYTGSKSREFTVEYKINVDHLYKNGNVLPQIQPSPSKQGQAEFSPSKSAGRTGGVSNYVKNMGVDDFSTTTAQESSQTNSKRNALNLIDYQVNLVRSMAVNNADQPTQAPPVVRLNHGLLYQDIPCICESYDIAQDTGDAHDVDFGSKVSNKTITITIKLKESRTGDYQKTKFSPSSAKSRDNIVGWEQILSGGSLDPITPIYS
jgi:hypothetical protein